MAWSERTHPMVWLGLWMAVGLCTWGVLKILGLL